MAAQGRSAILFLSILCLLFCLLAPVYAQTQHDLLINVIPSDGGTVKADCTTPCQYNVEAWAHLLAIPNSGYVFNYWDVDCTGSNPSFRVLMTGPKTCNANFLPCAYMPFKMGESYYGSFLEAYKLASGGETIDVLATTIQESLRLDRLIPVTLKGGYRCWDESTPSSYTLLQGQMIFKEGTGTVENLMILSGTPPVITSFTADPLLILSGESSTLHWTVADATEVYIDDVLVEDPIRGSVIVSPSSTATYTLKAMNSYGVDTKQVTVTVTPTIQPKITAFSAAPDVVSSGQSSMLTWVVTDASTVSIDQGIGTVNASDTRQVSPTSTTVYTISAVNGPVTVTRTVTVGVIPETVIAPAIDQSVATSVYDASSFLYTGTSPVQTGMTPETIEPKRVAVLKGKVMDRDNNPLPGVTITILNHPEFGQTITRADDGMFDIAVNGGGPLTVRYHKNGYLESHRQIDVPWQNYFQMPEVIMSLVDPKVTTVDLANPVPIQAAQGSQVTDDAGTRQATLLFSQGTQANLVMPDGSTQPITALNVRATEYTVGSDSPKLMPAKLPSNSAITYCVEFSADEAMDAGASGVQFDRPVISYLDNYLEGQVGWNVPLGYYDRIKGAWITSESGRIIKILSINGSGLAEVDIDGSGNPANADALTALGITDAEREKLANMYGVGKTLWRMPIPHFTAWDANWAFGPPDDATFPGQKRPENDRKKCPSTTVGSFIECENQTMGEDVPVTGTAFYLHYGSDRVLGRKPVVEIPLSGATVPDSLTRIELEISVAGRLFTHQVVGGVCPQPCLSGNWSILPGGGLKCEPALVSGAFSTALAVPTPQASQTALTNQSYTFVWDGKDAYGRTVQGSQLLTIRIGYVYCGVYQKTDKFGYNGNGMITGSKTREEVTLWQEHRLWMKLWDARPQGVGAWSLHVHHAYDPFAKVLYEGNGATNYAEQMARVISTVAGTGESCYPYTGQCGDGGPATDAKLSRTYDIAVAPDGSLYIADGHRVRRVGPDGIITTFAGTGIPCPSPTTACGDGGPARQAQFQTSSLALGPDGSLYIGDTYRVRRIGPDGIITTVAGNGNSCDNWYGDGCGDNCPAIQVKIGTPRGIAVGPDGSIYFAEGGQQRVRRVGPDGIITTVAGYGRDMWGLCSSYMPCGDGGPATQANLDAWGVTLGPDGSLYITDLGRNRIRRVTQDGIIKTVAGTGSQCGVYQGPPPPCGDGELAINAALNYPEAVAVDANGYVYIADAGDYKIRMVSPEGIITTIAGTGGFCTSSAGECGESGPATQYRFKGYMEGVAVAKDGSIYTTTDLNFRVFRIGTPLAGMLSSNYVIPSEDDSEIYTFDGSGRHLRTLNALTGAVKYEFGYDASWRLVTITDQDGNVTTISRDSSGNPTAIIAPFGQSTTLELDANGYLSRITNPANESEQFSYTNDGLLSTLTDPKGGVYLFNYDDQGRLKKDEDPAGGSKTLTRTEIENGYEVTLATEMNRVTKYEVQHLPTGDHQSLTTFADNTQKIALTRTDESRLDTLPNGTTIDSILGPDPRFGMQTPLLSNLKISTPGGLTNEVSESQTVTFTDPNNILSLATLKDELTINGQKYTINYTASTKTFTSTSPAGRQVTSKIDAQGRPVEYQIAGILPVQFTYDAQGRLISARQGSVPDVRESTFQYNTQGFLQMVTDALANVMSFEYDGAGRITRKILPDSREVISAYDANGNMTSLMPPGRPSHLFTYNPVDQTAEYIPPDIGIGAVKTQYTYNTDRQLKQVLRPDGAAVDFGYDAGGRLSVVAYPGGPVTYTYDPVKGYITGIDGPGGNSISYAYDGILETSENWSGDATGSVSWTYDTSFRVNGISINGGNTVTYQYDNDSLLTKAGDLTLSRSAQNGFLTGSTLGNVTDAWTYNSFGEPASYAANYGATEIFKQQFTYDKIGRIAQKIETVEGAANTYDYLYDPAGRLKEVKKNGSTVSTYTYDSNDNRLTGPIITTIYTYDAQDRLVNRSSVLGIQSYTYTANGELQGKTSVGQTTLYNYDVFGNLKSVTLPGGTLIEYVVDGQNRRVGKKVNGALVHKLLYRDDLKPIAELDGGNNVTSLFIYGSRDTTPDYMIKGSVTYRIISDHLDSPRLVVDTATGAVVQRMEYDEFGNVVQDTNPGFQPFGFAGGTYDHETKLIRFGVRDYDTEIGRWILKDPIRFAGRGANLYVYVMNDPVNRIDPTGESWVDWVLPCHKIYRKAKKVYDCRNAASAEDCFEKMVFGDLPESEKNWIKSKVQGAKWWIEDKMSRLSNGLQGRP